MLKHMKEKGNNPQCSHKWIMRSKKHLDILERACTECGQVEFHSESELDGETVKRIMGD